MNTIPITFNERKVPHTIVGGPVRLGEEEREQLTVILLNRGGRYYRSAVFQSLETAGFTSVISIEMSNEPYDIEQLSTRFPRVKFLVPLEKASIGDIINTACAETDATYFFVMWNDIRMPNIGVPQRLLARLSEEPVLCTAPVLLGQKLEALPIQMVPAITKNVIQTEPLLCLRDNSPSLYAFDFTGIYHREKFIALGGFDHTIPNPYWQNLDFGFRAHLWGEKILISTVFRLSYDGDVPSEDVTTDMSYMKFYLKNLAPVRKKGETKIPFRCFFSFARKSGVTILDSWHWFVQASQWVRINRHRFLFDAASLASSWEPFLQ